MHRRHTVVFLAIAAFVVALALAGLVTQATAQREVSIALPGIKKEFTQDTPTPTIAATPWIDPLSGCDKVPIPQPAEGVQAWLAPASARVCVRLFVGSRYVMGLPVRVHVHEEYGDVVHYPALYTAPVSYQSYVLVLPAEIDRTADVVVDHNGHEYRTTITIPAQPQPTPSP